MRFSEKLQKLRKKNNLSQELLAEKLNVKIEDLIGLNNNASLISEVYHKQNFKKCCKFLILTSIIFLVPILYFLWVGNVSLKALTATLAIKCASVISNEDLSAIFLSSWNVFKIYIIEFIAYCILLLINYILYSKKCKKTLIVLNSFFFIITFYYLIQTIMGQFESYDIFIFTFASIIGFIFTYKLFKK